MQLWRSSGNAADLQGSGGWAAWQLVALLSGGSSFGACF